MGGGGSKPEKQEANEIKKALERIYIDANTYIIDNNKEAFTNINNNSTIYLMVIGIVIIIFLLYKKMKKR